VHELIGSEGEEAFRRIEASALAEAAERGPAVISLGGGAVTREENRRLLASSGLSIWLDAPFDLCWRRIRCDSQRRPLAPSEEAARERYEERQTLYRESRLHIRIEEGRSADEIADEITARLSSLIPRLRESSG
jgi:shikimate kinase